MQKKNIEASAIKSDIKTILNESAVVIPADAVSEEKIFDLSALRARLFKASYTAREINATLAGFLKRGLMKAISEDEKEVNYVFSKKLYE